jgi:putative transposase
MKNYYNAKELAGLSGLPGTENSVRRMARRNLWKHRPRKGLGGGQEFHLSSLPLETRAALAAKTMEHPKTLPSTKTAAKTVNKQALAHALRELAAIQRQQELLFSESRNLVEKLLSATEAAQ